MLAARLRNSPAENRAVERCETFLVHFPPLGFGSIHAGAVPELVWPKVLRNGADAGFHLLRGRRITLPLAGSSQCHMDVRVLGVEMGDGNSVERSPQIFLYRFHQVPREADEIDALAEFR
jgi:hypothetical protein